MDTNYSHTQRAPLCLLLYANALLLFVISLSLQNQWLGQWFLPMIGGIVLLLAASFHYLKVEDEGEALSVRFGPLPLFRRTVPYRDIQSVEVVRSSLMDGWGIHWSSKGGWIWNLWGRDCVMLQLDRGVLIIGTDRPQELHAFLEQQVSSSVTDSQ